MSSRKRALIPIAVCMALVATGQSAELQLRIERQSQDSDVVAFLFDSPSAFVDLRDPIRTAILPAHSDSSLTFEDVRGGKYAVVVFQDDNGNEQLDRNFVGIPREAIGFSNRYRPHGPPTFERAAFVLEEGESASMDIALKPMLGRRGQVGVGVGAIVKTSPYRGSDNAVVRILPAITYVGRRLQLLGPRAQFGIVNWGKLRLAATASYRPGPYDEGDSEALEGMGDRDDLLMAGLALQARLPAGLNLGLGYEHDILDRAGGGIARFAVRKSIQQKFITLTPSLGLNWLTADMADYEFGVAQEFARTDRPAHDTGSAVNIETGLSVFFELSGAWRVILNGSVEFLSSEISASPIVDESRLWSSFAAINRTF